MGNCHCIRVTENKKKYDQIYFIVLSKALLDGGQCFTPRNKCMISSDSVI